ncbi:MAG: PadR family transcriptional regulator [Candidatus Nanohaloarchaeota archaeon QJJ-5]|nr:PadR family transcriptional regulator [Candidatus Nanohaloarchaeota archaeon QJJ-5]
MAEIDLSNVNRLYTVLLLASGGKHGYQLIKEIENITGTKPTTSHIYPFLDKLAEKGLVEAEKQGNRGKKVYHLTEAGEDLVEEQLNSFGTILEAAIEGEIEECTHCGCEIYKGGYEDAGELFCCEHCAAASKEV